MSRHELWHTKSQPTSEDLSNDPRTLGALERIRTSRSLLLDLQDSVTSLGYKPPVTLTDSIESLASTYDDLKNIERDSLYSLDV